MRRFRAGAIPRELLPDAYGPGGEFPASTRDLVHDPRFGTDPDGTWPIFDATGSTIAPGRWNTRGSPVIYASEHYSTALLEKLVHGSGRLPPNQHFIEITIPAGTSYEMFAPEAWPGWDAMPPVISRRFGEAW